MINANRGKLPTHLLIGTRKSATSWIWKQFSDHPEIYVNPQKEIYFFNKNYDLGKKWYKKNFLTNKKIVIDTTPDYFYEQYAKKIKETLENSLLFACLRNPVERAYSHWKFGTYIGTCKKNFIESWNYDWNGIRTCGLYDVHLQSFLKYYELNKSIKVLIYDELIKNKNLFMNEIYDFIGAKKHTSVFFEKKWMPGGVSDKNLEQKYESISKEKMNKNDEIKLQEYYFPSIKKLEYLINYKTNWTKDFYKL